MAPGFSHYSAAGQMDSSVTMERITEILCVFARNGINAYLASPDPQSREVLHRVKEETGVTMHLIATPSGEHIDDLLPGIEQSAEQGAAICLPHQHWTDGNLVANETRIIGIEQYGASASWDDSWSLNPSSRRSSATRPVTMSKPISKSSPIGFLPGGNGLIERLTTRPNHHLHRRWRLPCTAADRARSCITIKPTTPCVSARCATRGGR